MQTIFTARILTIACYGELPAGWVPCISRPLLELGNGKVEDAPMLVLLSALISSIRASGRCTLPHLTAWLADVL